MLRNDLQRFSVFFIKVVYRSPLMLGRGINGAGGYGGSGGAAGKARAGGSVEGGAIYKVRTVLPSLWFDYGTRVNQN
jgi:hypothetical protein